jgi:hypothetical protein
LLVTKYDVDMRHLGTSASGARLEDLDLDSLSLQSFLTELEHEFGLGLDELRSIARRDCPLVQVFDVCHTAALRAHCTPSLSALTTKLWSHSSELH